MNYLAIIFIVFLIVLIIIIFFNIIEINCLTEYYENNQLLCKSFEEKLLMGIRHIIVYSTGISYLGIIICTNNLKFSNKSFY
jgi:hypothetical protein